MPMLKRPAAALASESAAAVEPQTKRQQGVKEDPLSIKCRAISTLLESAEGYPLEALRVLSGAARACLCVPRDERHSIQNNVIEMMAEVLASDGSSHETKIAMLEGKVSEADAEKARRQALVESATADRLQRVDVLEAATTTHEEAMGKKATASTEFAHVEAEHENVQMERAKAIDKKTAIESAMADFSALKEGTVANIPTAVKRVSKIGKDAGLEAQLLVSAEPVLMKGPSERGDFEGMVLREMEVQFNAAIQKLDEQLTSSEASHATSASKVKAAAEALAAATAEEVACKEKVGSADASVKEAEQARKAAAKSVKDLGSEMMKAVADAEAAKGILVESKEVLATFRELVDGPVATPEKISMEERMGAFDAAAEDLGSEMMKAVADVEAAKGILVDSKEVLATFRELVDGPVATPERMKITMEERMGAFDAAAVVEAAVAPEQAEATEAAATREQAEATEA